jgi:hypothetical protein
MAQIILDSNNNLIQGDFDNATLNNRTKLQTTTTNATTNVYVVPNGSSTSAGVSVANNSSLTNASKIVMATNGTTDTQIISGVNGSGTYLPLSFYTNNALAAQIDTSGNFFGTGKMGGVGSVIQVVNTTYSTSVSSITSTYVDTGVTASITPSSTSNKILITVQINGTAKQGANVNLRTRLNRSGTTILYIDSLAGNDQSTAFLSPGTVGTTYLDSPSTTSAITYTVQISNISSSGSVAINDAAGGTVSTSTITLMEIKG